MQKPKKHVLRIETSLLNPCHIFFKLWMTININNSEYQLKIVTFEDDHFNILSMIENLGKDIDFFIGTCGSISWLARCNFYPLGYHYLSYSHQLAELKIVQMK